MKTVLAATAVSLGLAATPVSAQVLGAGRGDVYDGRTNGYNTDGTLNVFGARIDPQGSRTGLLGGVGNVVDGVGGVVGGVTGAADDIVTGSVAPRRGDVRYLDRPAAGERRGAY